jgi:TRAP-type C4-dicarboxylate transport system permease small subunit
VPRFFFRAAPVTAQKPPFESFDRIVVPALRSLAALVLFFLMALTCADVFGRYLLNRPIWGAFELTEIALAALIFAGLPMVTLRNDHVTVDLFDPVTPDWLFRVQHVFACAVGFVCTAFLAYRLWVRADKMYQAGETTAQLKLTLAWLTWWMALMMALTAVAVAILAFRRPQRHYSDTDSGRL